MADELQAFQGLYCMELLHTSVTKHTTSEQRYTEVRLRNKCCHTNVTIRSLFVAASVNVAVNNIKVFSASWEFNTEFPLHCCPATKYLVLLSTTISIIHYYDSVSVFLS